MTTRATELEAELDTWPGVTTDASRFECCEFSLGAREIGRLYGGVEVEIAFDRRVRDALLESDVDVSIHRVRPDSGWLIYELDGDESIDRAIDLLRLAYLSQVAILQRRAGADHELALVDVDRELEALEVTDRACTIVRAELLPESANEREVESETGTESASEARTDETETTDRDDREPDEGIPSPT